MTPSGAGFAATRRRESCRGGDAARTFRPLLLAALLIVPLPMSTGRAQTAERSGTLGPADGETLRSWTDRWLEGPVQLIATDDEKRLYADLDTVAERLQFIRLFWERRDPTARDADNEFREEFERRVAYASEEFGNGEPGWKTAFGQVALIVGIPHRVLQTSQGMAGLSERPLVVWSYDKRIAEWPNMENFIFAYRSRAWRLLPHSENRLRGSARQAQSAWDLTTSMEVVPDDFLRVQRAMVQETALHPPRYGFIDRVTAAVAFPEGDIPFTWRTAFDDAATPGLTRIELRVELRLDALFYQAEQNTYRSRTLLSATLLDADGEPTFSHTEPLVVVVPVNELEARGDEIIGQTVVLDAAPGEYRFELVLEDPSLGYRTVYRDQLIVPSH